VQSRNGIEWEEVPVEGRGFGSVAFGDGRFVSLGFTVRISTNGFQWDEMTSKPPRNTTSIAYGAGRFVSVGEGISVSSDGLNWTDLACCEGPFAEVVYANGVFLTAGYDAKMFSSTDGTNWTRHPSPWPEYINGTPTYIGGITFGQGRFVIAGGGSGFIVESGQLVPEFDAGQFHVRTDGSARIRVEAYRGQNLQLEASSDLGDWTPLTNGTLADDFLEYTESPGPSPERRFYRAKLLPQP
jgi:hypothetical protein